MLTKPQGEILEWMLSEEVYYSPYRFAMTAYPWGEGDLKVFDGPRNWLRRITTAQFQNFFNSRKILEHDNYSLREI